ncbi:MAG: hypothetical protein M3323_11130 [Actinomycetota bacterium]|nr:hypothetical protein [Actinomycetota bacterium]
MTARAEVGLSVLDSRFCITSDDDRMLAFVRRLWEPFATDDLDDAALIGIETQREGWRLDAPPQTETFAIDPWVFASVLRNALTRRAVAEARSVFPLHGAAAERDGTFVVLSAPPLAGKTTLLLELLARGWRLVTDDLVPLEPGGLTAAPFPKPISVRDPARWQRVASSWDVPTWLPPPTTVGLIPATAFARTDASAFTPTALVFSRFESGAAPAAERLSAGRTVAACAENLHPVVAATPAALQAVARLGSATPGWAITYGSTDAAVDLFEKSLAAL